MPLPLLGQSRESQRVQWDMKTYRMRCTPVDVVNGRVNNFCRLQRAKVLHVIYSHDNFGCVTCRQLARVAHRRMRADTWRKYNSEQCRMLGHDFFVVYRRAGSQIFS